MEQTYATELQDADLYDFLVNAPKKFKENERIKKFQMKNGDFIHCCLWNYHFYISGTDIVKILIYRFQLEGRQINNLKKFEEGIFSDLRNLKPGIDATLEGPRSDFLEFMYKNGCIRTQKKQKVFYWYSVPHDALFCDAMERDVRRETFFVTTNPYNNGKGYNNVIFNNTKTNRNIVKQRTHKVPVEIRAPLFFETEMFGQRESGKQTLLSKALFDQEDTMSHIVKKTNKKSNILDEIVNYNRKTRKDILADDHLFTERRQRNEDSFSFASSTPTVGAERCRELDSLIKTADEQLKGSYVDIDEFLYSGKPLYTEKKEEEMVEVGSKVEFINKDNN